jgi:AraC-like DNA-binding protein
MAGMAGAGDDLVGSGRRSESATPTDGLLWDITAPSRRFALDGVQAAGFTDRGITPSELRLIPHPALTLILVFDGTFAVESAAGQRLRGSLVLPPGYGQVLRSLQLDGFTCLQVRLSPVVAGAVLGGAAAELGGVVPLEDVLGGDAVRLTDRLAGDDSWSSRFAAVEEWLIRRGSSGAAATPEMAWAWKRIEESRGSIRIDRLASDLGWSRRQLWARFRSQLGVTPKNAAKLVRFDHAVHRLSIGQSPAQVAADTGFSDQAHLHRDVASFTGLTPSTVGDEPFLAVDDVAWGWPGRDTTAGIAVVDA